MTAASERFDVESERRRVGAMTEGELRQRYQEIGGDEARSRNREELIRRILWMLQAGVYGGLSERAVALADGLARDFDVRAPVRAMQDAFEVPSPDVLRQSVRIVGLVSDNLNRVRSACARRGVSFLELVGSAARDDFDPEHSDIDVLVDFPDHTQDLFGAYMGLREDLAEILGRPVDVITLRGIRNPLFLESLRRDAVQLYAA